MKNENHKFWNSTQINKIINEIIEPNNVDVSSITVNDILSPLLWDDNNGEFKLKTEVRKTLLLNIKYFIDFCDLSGFKFKDLILTGSMANYNYSSYSDIDIHIIFDYKQISEDEEFVSEYFKTKRDLWSIKTPTKMFEHNIEFYVQNINQEHTSTGIYSIYHDNWVIKPIKKIINVDADKLREKSSYFMNEIDEMSDIKDINIFIKKYNILKNKIKDYRKCGLDKNGELSLENLVFKVLRNNGYLDKLFELKNEKLRNELSI